MPEEIVAADPSRGRARGSEWIAPAARWAVPVAAAGLLLCLWGAAAPAQTCTGDCDGDGTVGVDELIRAVNIALGSESVAACEAADANQDTILGIEELVAAVGAAVDGCGEASDLVDRLIGTSRATLSTAGSFGLLDFGPLARGGVVVSGGALAGRGAGAVTEPCSGGGSVEIDCRRVGADSVIDEAFRACRRLDPSRNVYAIRNGTRRQTVAGRDVCDTLEVPEDTTVTVELTGFIEILRDTTGVFLQQTDANLSDVVTPGPQGCARQHRTEEIDGTLVRMCVSGCTAGLQDVRLTAGGLLLERGSSPPRQDGEDCRPVTMMSGDLVIDNRITGERFEESLQGLAVTEMGEGSFGTLLDLDGFLSIGCLGATKLETKRPILLAADDKCAGDGAIDVSLPNGAEPGAAPFSATASAAGLALALRDAVSSTAFLSAGNLRANAALDNAGFRESAFRAANGAAYQVLQNVDADATLGADAFHVTTLVGSLQTAQGCFGAASAEVDAEAVVASPLGGAVSPDRVFKSRRIGFATAPCFSPDARGGNGIVCIGPDCTAECDCPGGGACREFSIGEGSGIATATDTPAGARVDALGGLGSGCAGLEGYSTYGFGPDAPTTRAALCAPEPEDGFALERGTSLIVAYDVPFASQFVAGSAGFPVTRDADETSGCDADELVGVGRANLNILRPPRIRFTAGGGVQFDLNNDGAADRTFASCDDEELLECVARPITPPTPTGDCPQFNLPNPLPVERAGDTTNGTNSSGGASCGGGGNAAADLTFGYKASRSGFYVIDTAGSSFDTLLYVRSASCGGPELACNDDRRFGDPTSEVGLVLGEGDEIVIVVDGFGGQEGAFNVRVRFVADEPPTPTPTPTPAADLPDLTVVDVTAPPSGVIGAAISVSATVLNEGTADAGAFQVQFAFSTDAVITGDDVLSGFGCVFGGLGAGQAATCSGPIQVPESLAPGAYFIGAIADLPDRVRESDEQNNSRAASSTTTVGAPAPTLAATRTRTPTVTVTATPAPSPTVTPTGTPTSTPTPTVPSMDLRVSPRSAVRPSSPPVRYLPRNRGRRFSRNARTPSARSSVVCSST